MLQLSAKFTPCAMLSANSETIDTLNTAAIINLIFSQQRKNYSAIFAVFNAIVSFFVLSNLNQSTIHPGS